MLSREEEQDTAGIILQLSVCSKTVANAERAGIGVNMLKQSGGMPYGGNYDMRHGRWHGRSNCRKKGNPGIDISISFAHHLSPFTPPLVTSSACETHF